MANPGTDPLDDSSDTGSETGAKKAGDMAARAKEKAGELKRQAERAAGDMRHRARSAAMDQKNVAASRMEGIAHALRTASDDLQTQGQPTFAEYSRHVAEGLESMADSRCRRPRGERGGLRASAAGRVPRRRRGRRVRACPLHEELVGAPPRPSTGIALGWRGGGYGRRLHAWNR
jgi:hypothetical protein